nr:uncharacterized protein LOC104086756 [Nicotiana tomentosiformis]
MPKAGQTPFKAKSSTKSEAKPKIFKPKSKKNDKPSREPTPTPAPFPSISSHVPTAPIPIIPTSTVPPLSKVTTHAPELPTKNTSKSAKLKATSRNLSRSCLRLLHKVPHPTSKLDVLVSTIDVAPLDILPPRSEKSPVEKFTIEECKESRKRGEYNGCGVCGFGRGDDLMNQCKMRLLMTLILVGLGMRKVMKVKKEEETVNNHEKHDAQNIPNEEEKRENEGVSGDEKESDTEDKTGEYANDSAEEENHSEEDGVS